MSSLKKNFSYLFLGQLFNNFLPLALIPYLTRKLSIEAYGVYAYTVVVIGFIAVLLDFGFGFYGVERVVKTRGVIKRLRLVHSGILSAKLIILIFAVSVYFLFVFFNGNFQNHRIKMLIGIVSIIGISFQQFWFFGGIEKNYLAVFSVLIGKLFLLFSVILFVENEEDLGWLVALNAFSQCLIAAVSYYFLRNYKINFNFEFNRGMRFLRKSYPFFISRLAVALYSSAVGVHLGLFSNASSVAIYSLAEQMYKGIQSLISPLSQVMYPYMLRTKNFIFLYKIILIVTIFTIISAFLGYKVAPYFIEYFFGAEYIDSARVFGIFLITFIFVVPSILLGYPLLGARGKIELANRSVIFAGFFQILVLIFVTFLNMVTPISMALTVLFVEALVLLFRVKWGLWDFRNHGKN